MTIIVILFSFLQKKNRPGGDFEELTKYVSLDLNLMMMKTDEIENKIVRKISLYLKDNFMHAVKFV